LSFHPLGSFRQNRAGPDGLARRVEAGQAIRDDQRRLGEDQPKLPRDFFLGYLRGGCSTVARPDH
jgi:hypothetical protein